MIFSTSLFVLLTINSTKLFVNLLIELRQSAPSVVASKTSQRKYNKLICLFVYFLSFSKISQVFICSVIFGCLCVFMVQEEYMTMLFGTHIQY